MMAIGSLKEPVAFVQTNALTLSTALISFVPLKSLLFSPGVMCGRIGFEKTVSYMLNMHSG